MSCRDASVSAAAVVMLACGSMANAAVCNVQSAGIAFGSYDTLSPTPVDSVGTISVDCDVETAFTIDLGPGAGAVDQRILSSGMSALQYNLYADASRTAIWGDGISGTNVSASGTNFSISVYGRIPARQNVEAGIYSDSVTITLSY